MAIDFSGIPRAKEGTVDAFGLGDTLAFEGEGARGTPNIDLAKVPRVAPQAPAAEPQSTPDGNVIDFTGIPSLVPEGLSTRYQQVAESPDQAAKIINLSELTGVPETTVRNRQSDVQKKVQEPDWEKLQQESPVLADALNDDLQLFRLAHDDTDNLNALGKMLRFGSEATKRLEIGAARFGADMTALSGVTTGVGEFIMGQDSDASSRLLAAADKKRAEIELMRLGMGPRTRSDAEEGLLQGFESIPQGVATLSSAILSRGNPRVTSAALALFFGAPTTGGSAQDALRAGLTAPEALSFGVVQGTIEVLTEQFPVMRALRNIKVGEPLWRILLENQIGEQLGEQIATHLQSFNEWMVLHPEKTFDEFMAERPKEAFITMMATLSGSTVQTGIGVGISKLNGMFGSEKLNAEQAKAFKNRLDELTVLARDSKLRERNPEKFQELVEKMLKTNPDANVYINAQEFNEFFQDQGINPLEVAANLTGVANQLPEALVKNGDIAIKASEYVTHLGSSDTAVGMSEIVKVEPSAMSAKEAAEWEANEGERFDQLAAEIEKANENNTEWQQSADQVQTFITEQIAQTGRFDEQTAAKYATLHRSFAQVLATRLGIQPHQVYERFGLNVAATPLVTVDGQTFEQADVQQFPEVAMQIADLREVPGNDLRKPPEDMVEFTRKIQSGEIKPTIIVETQNGVPTNIIEGNHTLAVLDALGEAEVTVRTIERRDPNILDQPPPPPPHGEGRRVVAKAFKREKKSGRYVGAPDYIGNSPAKLGALFKKLKKLALEGEPGRFWYENSSQAILRLVGDDIAEAEKIVALIAIYSPNATVPANTTMALTAYYQWQANGKINAGFSEADIKAENLMGKGEYWSGIKTNTFYQNLMVEIDASKLDPGAATMDMWMAIAADYGMKVLDQGPKYQFMETMINNVAEAHGWLPHQAQAAIWTAMKGRVDPIRPALKKRELKLGIGELVTKTDPKTGKEKQVYVIKDRKAHFKLAHKMGMAHKVTVGDIQSSGYDFSDAIEASGLMISWEATPGKTTGVLPGIHNATVEQQMEYLVAVQEILQPDGNDVIAEMAGILQGEALLGFSAWEGAIGAGAQTLTAAPLGDVPTGGVPKVLRGVKPEARELLNLYAAIKGYILNQEAVVWHSPIFDKVKKRHNGLDIRAQRPLTELEMTQLYEALNKEFDTWELAPAYTPNGARVLNFIEDLDNIDYQKRVTKVLESLPDEWADGEVTQAAFRSDGEYIFNDWQENPNGESYTDRITTGRPGLQTEAAKLRSRVATLNKKFAKRYGWDKEGGDGISGRPSPTVREDGKVELTHWSRVQGIKTLDPQFHGTGVAGAERGRKGTPNWVDRTYYGIDVGNENGYRKEQQLGRIRYTATVPADKMYDLRADPDHLRADSEDQTHVEKRIKDAGYAGYWVHHDGMGLVSAVFNKLDAETEVDEFEEQRGREFDQPVFHGSQALFDKFSAEFIDTGEGAQAFGWGIYLAETPGVAESYRTAGSFNALPATPEFEWLGEESAAEIGIKLLDTAALTQDTVTQVIADREAVGAQGVAWDQAVKDISEGNFKIKEDEVPKGNLFEVELPDNAIESMLDWDAPLSEQKGEVLEGIKDVFDTMSSQAKDHRTASLLSFEFDRLDKESSGEALYKKLSEMLGGDVQASNALSREGIQGIKYFDAISRGEGEGTRNFVVFDPTILTILSLNGKPITQQEFQQERRGSIQFPPDITDAPSIITMFEAADLTTFLHESGHFFFEVYRTLANEPNANPDILKDMESLLKFVGVKDLATWNAMEPEARREGHEKVARAFEAYIFGGDAPSPGMRDLFRTFSQWLTHVYRNIRNLNVELTPEIKQVFDRMLATEDEIQATETLRQYAPLFESMEQAGMTVEEWARYQALGETATEDADVELQRRSLKDMRWLTGARTRELRRLQRDAKAKRKAMQAEAEERLYEQPVYAAMRFLTHGDREPITTNKAARRLAQALSMDGTKLAKTALVQMYGNEANALWRHLPTGKRGMMAQDGIHPNELALLFGFGARGGDTLVRQMLETKPPVEAIEELTDQMMMERYGDINNPAVLERAADKAVHNDARIKFMATELKALDDMMKVRGDTGRIDARGRKVTFNVLAKAAREFAERSIGKKKVKDAGKTSEYSAAEVRAGKATTKAMRDGDIQQAAEHKRAQLLNAHFFRTANRAGDEIDRTLRFLKKFDNEGTRKNLDREYLDQIDQLLEQYDLRKGVTQKALRERTQLANWIDEQQEQGFDPAVSQDLIDQARKQHYTLVTMDEFRGLKDAVKSIEHLGRLKKKLLTAKDKREFDAIIDAAVTSIETNSRGKRGKKIETDLPQDKAAKAAGQFYAWHLKLAEILRRMDGGKDNGAMWQLLMRPLNAASDNETEMRRQATAHLSELFNNLQSQEGKLYQQEEIPGIELPMSKMGRLMVALNLGNDVNRMRVKQGYGWTDEQIDAIVGDLTEADWVFVQSIFDFINSYWPEITAKQERVNGVKLEKVEATPILTPFGEIPGGYFPLKYDTEQSPRAQQDATADAAKDAMRGARARATTRRGHLEQRAEEVNRPVTLSFSTIFQHVDQVLHDIAMHEFLIDSAKVLNDKRIQTTIVDHYGIEFYKQITNAMQSVAAGDVPATNIAESAANWLRTGSSIAAMGWKMWTAMLQPIGLTQSMQRIGVKWVGRGIAKWMGGQRQMESTTQWIHSVSPMMRHRGAGLTLQREINDIRNKISKESWFTEQMAKAAQTIGLEQAPDVASSFFWLIAKAQMVADIPTWLGQYEKSMAEGLLESEAIAVADQAVLDSQGGGQVKDLAGLQRGGPFFKLWTNFYSYFNVTMNRSAAAIASTDFKSPASVGQMAVDLMLLQTLPATLTALMALLLKGGCDDADLECIGKKVAEEQVSYLLGNFFGLREFSAAFTPFDYQGPAGARLIAETVRLGKQIGQGEVDAALLRAANNAAGTLFHYPAGQVQATVQGLFAILEGDTQTPTAIAFGPRR